MDKKLIVLKVGTSSLTDSSGAMSTEKVYAVCNGAADLRDAGHGVIIVTSGSIAAGFRRLGYTKRPTALAAKQASAAVGQGLLMQAYETGFSVRGYTAAQILLTPDAFTDKDKYKNAFSTLQTLVSRGAIPIINENDTVATAEIRIGDNDTLSAQVAGMVHADRLVLLTDVDGLYTAAPGKDPGARRIDRIEHITPEIESYAAGAGSANGTGGMQTKISSARLATAAGVEVFICRFTGRSAVAGSVDGTVPGTLFLADGNLRTKQQWVAFYAKSAGTLTVDEGAADAVKNRHKSLLRAGILSVAGHFESGAVVDICTAGGERIARGITSYGSAELRKAPGEGRDTYPAVHIDNITITN